MVRIDEDSANDDLGTPKDELVSAADIITDLVADTATPGIPAPVRRNFLKAFGQLCSAAVDVPAAFLTGIADERRAETAARIKLINTSASQIAQQMQTDPVYARVAVEKFGHRVLREQVNLDLISQKAASEIRDASDSSGQSETDESGESISDDWLNAFETEARQKSTDEMQDLFGRILAGEIRQPGSYSTKAVRILGSLDQSVANHFLRLCSMGISLFGNVMVCSLGGDAGINALREYGLDVRTLNLLNEYGLIIPHFNAGLTYEFYQAVPGEGRKAELVPFSYQGRYWVLMPVSNDEIGKSLTIRGVALTLAGSELFRIVKIEPMDKYSKGLLEFFDRNGVGMTEVRGGGPRIVSLNTAAGVDSQ